MKLTGNSYFYSNSSPNEKVAVKIVWYQDNQNVEAKVYVETPTFKGLLCIVQVSVPVPSEDMWFMNFLCKMYKKFTGRGVEVKDLKTSFLVFRPFPHFNMSMYFRPSDHCFYLDVSSALDHNIRISIEREHMDCLCSDQKYKPTDEVDRFIDDLYYRPVIIRRKNVNKHKKSLIYLDLKKLKSKKTNS